MCGMNIMQLLERRYTYISSLAQIWSWWCHYWCLRYTIVTYFFTLSRCRVCLSRGGRTSLGEKLGTSRMHFFVAFYTHLRYTHVLLCCSVCHCSFWSKMLCSCCFFIAVSVRVLYTMSCTFYILTTLYILACVRVYSQPFWVLFVNISAL